MSRTFILCSCYLTSAYCTKRATCYTMIVSACITDNGEYPPVHRRSNRGRTSASRRPSRKSGVWMKLEAEGADKPNRCFTLKLRHLSPPRCIVFCFAHSPLANPWSAQDLKHLACPSGRTLPGGGVDGVMADGEEGRGKREESRLLPR